MEGLIGLTDCGGWSRKFGLVWLGMVQIGFRLIRLLMFYWSANLYSSTKVCYYCNELSWYYCRQAVSQKRLWNLSTLTWEAAAISQHHHPWNVYRTPNGWNPKHPETRLDCHLWNHFNHSCRVFCCSFQLYEVFGCILDFNVSNLDISPQINAPATQMPESQSHRCAQGLTDKTGGWLGRKSSKSNAQFQCHRNKSSHLLGPVCCFWKIEVSQ